MTNHIKTSPSSVLFPSGAHIDNTVAGPSKFRYRSLLADIILRRDFKMLCTVLVVYSGEAAKVFADGKNATGSETPDVKERSIASLNRNRLESNNCSLSGTQNDRNINDESNLYAGDGASKEGQMSPRTRALMCDEQCDSIFTDTYSPPTGLTVHNGLATSSSSQSPNGRKVTEAYAEQERIILTHFQDCLNRLVNLGQIKEANCSLLSHRDTGGEKESVRLGTANASRTKTKNNQKVVPTDKLMSSRVLAQRARRERERNDGLCPRRLGQMQRREGEKYGQLLKQPRFFPVVPTDKLMALEANCSLLSHRDTGGEKESVRLGTANAIRTKTKNNQKVVPTDKYTSSRVLAQRARRERERNDALFRRRLGQMQRREGEKYGQLLKQPRFFPGLPPRRRARAAAEREANKLREARESIMHLHSFRQQSPPPLPVPIVP